MTDKISEAAELEMLRIYREDAIEALADNERVIKANSERIALLEWHLEKLRELIFHGYMQSAGIAPMVFVEDGPPTKKKAKK